jgi:hypothetical protein
MSPPLKNNGLIGSSRRKGYPGMPGYRLQCPVPRSTGDLEAEIGGSPVGGDILSDVSAVMVPVGVRIGVGVTVAEITTVVVTPGVAVITTVIVMVSGVGVGRGVGVKVGIGR